MEYHLNFKPLIKSSYCQTIMGTAIDLEKDIASKTHYVKLPDEDLLALEVSTPKRWGDNDWTVVLVHGLCGSHKSHYMKRLAKRFYKAGIQAVRVNLRGCGSGRGLAKGIYHSGCSPDVEHVLKDLKTHFPRSPMVLVGFSMGANVVLKLTGELNGSAKELLRGVVAVSPPVNLLASARLFTMPKNQIYAKYFIRLLLNDVNFLHSHFPDLPPHNLPPDLTINDFDELYVAPRANFSSALDYYRHSSSKRVIEKIDIPTKILFARDDPIIRDNELDNLKLPENIDIYKTEYGGHIGFVGLNIFKDFHWLDRVVYGWVKEFMEKGEEK